MKNGNKNQNLIDEIGKERAELVNFFLISNKTFAEGESFLLQKSTKIIDLSKSLIIKWNDKQKRNCQEYKIIKDHLSKFIKIWMLEKEEEFIVNDKTYLTFSYTPSQILKKALIFQKDFLNNQTNQRDVIIRKILHVLQILYENDYIYSNISASKIIITKDLKIIKFYDFSYQNYYGIHSHLENTKKHIEIIQAKRTDAEQIYFKSIGSLIFRILFNEDYKKTLNLESFINEKRISLKYADILKSLLDDKITADIKKEKISIFIQYIDQKESKLNLNGYFLNNFGNDFSEDFINKLELYKNKYPSMVQLGDSLYSKSFLLKMNRPNSPQIVLKKYKFKNIPYSSYGKAVEKEITNLLKCRNMLNIIQVSDIFTLKDSSSLFLFMEFCNGNTLRNYLTNFKGRIRLNDLKVIAYNLAMALLFLHNNDIVYKDLRPESILLVLDQNKMLENIKLGDLGLTRRIMKHENKTQNCNLQSYCSPEIFKKYYLNTNDKTSIGKSSDIYSYGLIIFYLYYGIEAFQLEENVKNKDRFLEGHWKKKLNMTGFDLDDNIQNLIKNCLKANYHKRFTIERILSDAFFIDSPISLYKIQQDKYDSFVAQKEEEDKSSKLKLYYSNPQEKLWIKIYTNRYFHNLRVRKYLLEQITIIEKINRNNVPFFTRLIYFNCSENCNPVAIFEFRNGYSLEDFIKVSPNKEGFSFKDIKTVFYCTLKCLESIYKLNYVHRNVFPKNILIETKERKKKSIKITQSYLNKIRIQGASRLEETSKKIFEFLESNFKILILDEKYDLMCLGTILFLMHYKYIPQTISDPKFDDALKSQSKQLVDELITFCFDFDFPHFDPKKPYTIARERKLI